MEIRLFLRLAFFLAFLSCFFGPRQVYGYEAIIPIDQTNIQTSYSFLHVKAVRFTNDDLVAFTITVIPSKNHRREDFSGNLEVSNVGANGQRHAIASTMVLAEKSHQLPTKDAIKKTKDERLVFHFWVAKDYLAVSHFRVEETYGKIDPGPVVYIINLRDFANEK